MPRGRPPKVTRETEKLIAECFLCAFTDEQTAQFVGLSAKTIQRMRAGDLCPTIKIAEFRRELAYRKKVWNGRGNWTGAAWFLERKYPHQFSKPEIQLQLNTVHNTTNQVLVIQAEVAGKISERVKAAESEIDKLLKARRPGHANGHGNGHSE